MKARIPDFSKYRPPNDNKRKLARDKHIKLAIPLKQQPEEHLKRRKSGALSARGPTKAPSMNKVKSAVRMNSKKQLKEVRVRSITPIKIKEEQKMMSVVGARTPDRRAARISNKSPR